MRSPLRFRLTEVQEGGRIFIWTQGASKKGEGKMMKGMLPDSAIVGTAKRMNRAPRRRAKQTTSEGSVLGILTALFAIFA